MDQELERFKTWVNLTEFAASKGYGLVERESSQASVVMEHPNGDKIIVRREQDEHWVYFSVRDDRDNGTVIDFLLRRGCSNLGAVRRELRPWIGADRPRLPSPVFRSEVLPQCTDRKAVRVAYDSGTREAEESRYLLARGLSRQTQTSPRFRGAWRIDGRGNVVFPHTDAQGLSGYELKNANFTAFAAQGEKTLWRSNVFPTDTRLVIAESAIDAMSYYQLKPDEKTRYASTGGALGPQQRPVIREAILALGATGTIILAFDNDEAGERLSDEIRGLVALGNFVRSTPKKLKDWNDVLRAGLGLLPKP